MAENVSFQIAGVSGIFECFLLENEYDGELTGTAYYGLRLTKTDGSGLVETVELSDISVIRRDVETIRDLIVNGGVTPVHFYDIVSDWITAKY
ncbi:MAG: DUF6514 family protein [Clostridiales bacterium]|jgi:hypothetical protein|nr:DUF6514 family protein [Clostridiales bacterium]